MIYSFTQKCFSTVFISEITDKEENITYNTEEFHTDFANKLLQKKGKIKTITHTQIHSDFSISDIMESTHTQTHSDSSISDIMESTVQYYNIHTNTSDDNNDYWEHDNTTNEYNVDKSQNDSEIEELRKWAVTCNIPLTHLDKLLQILRKRLLPQLPKSSITFLNTSKATYNTKVMKGMKDCIGEYVYLGIHNGLKRCVDPNVHGDNPIYLQINVDGASLYHSSTKQLWPILCKVIFDPDIYSPFPVALYYADTKPGNVDEYMNDFIEEINLLQKNGVCIEGKKYTVQLKHIICDIPARKFLKQIKGHGGYAACERCEVYGKHLGFPNQRVVYPDEDCQKRSDQSFREQQQTEHHINVSPLLRIQPPIDLINAFPLDYMHMCCLGVVKKFYMMDLIFNKTAVRLKSTLREKGCTKITF